MEPNPKEIKVRPIYNIGIKNSLYRPCISNIPSNVKIQQRIAVEMRKSILDTMIDEKFKVILGKYTLFSKLALYTKVFDILSQD